MLLNADIKGLEVVVAAELSGDKVLKQEIIDKVDIHDSNRIRFGLGEGKPGRLVAKIFKFRLIYGGGAWSYAHDSDFTGVSQDVAFWQGVIDEYYAKYKGIAAWHAGLVETAKKQGYLEVPSGRCYTFKPIQKSPSSDIEWPITTIKNYPVQGFGADLVMLARIEFYKRFVASGLEGKFIQTIHDSLVVDTPSKNVYTISMMLQESVEAVPQLCKKHFNYDFSLPMTAEILVGPNKKDLKEFSFNKE